MIKKVIAFLFLLALLVGCHQTTSPLSQVLRINIGTDPQTLDPRKARDLTSVTLMHMLFEGLVRPSKTGDLEMAVADDVEISEDGVRYRFHLRKTFWSNGDPVTSYDFMESMRAILDPRFPTDIAYQLYVIKNGRKAKLGEIGLDQVGIQAPDAQTLVIDLEQAIPYFLELVSMSSFFPIPHKVAQSNPNWALQPETFICNGPFVLQSWQHADHIAVAKNLRYWQVKEVKLNGIELMMMAGDTEMRMFEEGKLDWAGSPLSTIPIDAVSAMKAKEMLHINPFSATYFYRVNTSEKIKEKKNPLAHPLFRRALAVCINRHAITDHILQGGQTPAKSLIPPAMGLSEKGYFHDDYKELARSLLTDALLALDLTLEKLDPIVISYSSSERNASIAQGIQRQWEEGLGLRVELEAVEPKTYFQRISQKDFQLAAGSWTADFNDPINFLEVFKYRDASTNNTCWENAKYIDLLNQSALCRDSEERKGLLREAEQILMEQMPIIPVFHFALNYLQREDLEEVALSPLGQIDFRWAHFSSAPSLSKR
jgi:oligopeptide transport system substrate-binding protein